MVGDEVTDEYTDREEVVDGSQHPNHDLYQAGVEGELRTSAGNGDIQNKWCKGHNYTQ